MADNSVNQSVERACYILDLFTLSKRELSLAEIAKECSLAVTTVMPLLKSLENAGLLERNTNNKKYRLGMKFVEKGQTVLSGIDLRDLASQPLRELAIKLEATTHLGLLDGDEVVIIDRYDRKQEWIDTIYPAFIGKRLLLHSTALGLVLSAYNKQVLKQPLEKLTPYTVTDEVQLAELQQEVINKGYVVDDEMNQINGLCVAAPVFSYSGKVCAAISVSMIKTEERIVALPEIIDVVKKTARQISNKMGYRK